MSVDPHACAHCGASLSLEQLRGQNCPYCGTVFPHHGRAVEQAKLVNMVMASQVQQASFGVPPPQIQVQYGAAPPQVMGPYGGPYNPYGDMHQYAARAANRSANTALIIVLIAVGLPILLGAVFAILLLVPF